MEKLLELEDITLIPSEMNRGSLQRKDFAAYDDTDNVTVSLPIFTSPNESIVDESNVKIWSDKGIRPVLPRSVELGTRLSACQYIFSVFSKREVIDNFINLSRFEQCQFRICIDTDDGNGCDTDVLNIITQLKKKYGNRCIIMVGNISNPKTYINYCKLGVDFCRVGMSSSFSDYGKRLGFHYPLASLLIDINGLKNTSCTGLKKTKIIADGGVLTPPDIVKCLALGADYVMCGRQLVRILEACGTIKAKNENEKNSEYEDITKEQAFDILSNRESNQGIKIKRLYGGVYSHPKIEWVPVNQTLKSWITDIQNCFSEAFTLCNAVNWNEFRTNVRFGRIQ